MLTVKSLGSISPNWLSPVMKYVSHQQEQNQFHLVKWNFLSVMCEFLVCAWIHHHTGAAGVQRRSIAFRRMPHSFKSNGLNNITRVIFLPLKMCACLGERESGRPPRLPLSCSKYNFCLSILSELATGSKDILLLFKKSVCHLQTFSSLLFLTFYISYDEVGLLKSIQCEEFDTLISYIKESNTV